MKWKPFGIFKTSFRVKIIVISIFFMLAACFFLTAFFVHHQNATLTDALRDRGGLLVRVLGHSARVGIFAENLELLKSPVDGIVEQREVIQVSVFGADGNLLYSAGKNPGEHREGSAGPQARVPGELAENLRSSDEAVYHESSDALQVWSAVFSMAAYSSAESLFFKDDHARNARQVIGFINVDISKKILNRQIYGFLLKAVLIAVAATIVGSALIFLVINSIAAPLNRLANGIKTLGTNKAAEPIPVDSKDEIGRLAMAFNDLSESLRKRNAENFQLETQLRQSQKLEALGTLAGGIAHDFNNILSPIFGYTEMSLEEVSENDLVYNNLQQVLSAAGRARDLVKQILAFSRQSERENLPLQVQVVLKEALKLLRASLPTTIAVTEQVDGRCGPVLADPTDIHRIVMNLGTNAYHAMRQHGGELHVVLKEETVTENTSRRLCNDVSPGRYVTLSMSDTGIGMDEKTLHRIFDPYFTTKPAGEGTGMGLAMAHGIVIACGGHVRVKSEINKGTTFKIYLPKMETDTELAVPHARELIPRGHERVLLVDDEVEITRMLKQMLEQLGYQVTVRTSSLEALEAFAADPGRFDLVITDQTMPSMTGDELAREIIRLRDDIPVILCTGFSEKITREKAVKTDVRAFLMKPVLKQQLAATIREVVNGSTRDQA